MKKFIYALFLLVSLTIVFSLSASAELYSPSYYGAQQVAAGTISIDGKVDAAYGNPIFYYIQDGTDDIGDPSKQENWFYTNGSLEDAQFIVTNPNQYAKGYVAWNGDKLYVCVDTNIDGWNFDNIVDGAIVGAGKMWQAYCLQIGIFDYEKGSNIDWGLGSDSNGNSHQYNFVSSNGALIPTGETQWEAAATRELNHVIYEAAIPLEKVLGRTPTAGSKIGMDICIDLSNVASGGAQSCLTFTNGNYHKRKIEDSRPLYFLDSTMPSVDEVHKNSLNEKELSADEHSVSLLGCNEEFGSFKLDTENAKAGIACLTTDIDIFTINETTFDPIDGSKFDSLEFELYVSDTKLFDIAWGDTGLELTSSGKCDSQEISWNLEKIKNGISGGPKTGWNHVVLHFKDASSNKKDGEINLSAINYMRLFLVGASESAGVTLKIDNMRLTDAYAAKIEQLKKDVEPIIERINKIEEVTAENYKDMASSITSARSAYNRLTTEQKALISSDVLAKLMTAENKLNEFKKADEEKRTDTTTAEQTEPVSDTDNSLDNSEKDNDNGTVIIVIIAAVIIIAIVISVVVLKKKKK